MNKPKPNISLINLSELKSIGISLALLKGANELFRRKKQKPERIITFPQKSYKNILSVIICTTNQSEISANAVRSIATQNFDVTKYEIIIVNNSSKPLTIKGLPDNARIIDEPELGLSQARNTGAKSASGEYLLYIDDDAIAEPGLLSSMYSAFETRKKCAIIGGQIFLKLPKPTPKVFLEGREALWSAYTVPYKSFREVREQYEFPFGACFGIRHSVLDALGGFPKKYGRTGNNFAGGEETALCFSALTLGHKIGINPASSVTHCVSPDRFTKEHIRRTMREGIITTYRLYTDGYAPSGWTYEYIKERLNIIKKELCRTSGLAAFYKQCEYDSFLELKEIMEQNLIPKE